MGKIEKAEQDFAAALKIAPRYKAEIEANAVKIKNWK